MNEVISDIFEFDEFRLDVSKRLLTRSNGENIPLTPKVFDTLVYLVRHRGKVIGKGGRIARSLRTVVKASAVRTGRRVHVEIAA